MFDVKDEDSGTYFCYGTWPDGKEFDASTTVLVGGVRLPLFSLVMCWYLRSQNNVQIVVECWG